MIRLDDPLDGLLPELADRRVVRRIDGPVDDAVPADPSEDITTILLTNAAFTSPRMPDIGRDFLTAAYAAITDHRSPTGGSAAG
ncbi:MAG: hypothetical protein ACXWCB_04645 [Acidimicrobiales bacterium]